MRRLVALTPAQLARAEERLLNPVPGSSIAAAKEYGVDLSLLLAKHRLTPAERARQMLEVCRLAEEVRRAALRRNP